MLRELLSDIRKGENIDLYATLTLAIVLAILKPILRVFGVNLSLDDSVPLMVSVLAAMTVVLLVNRKRMESVERHVARQIHSTIETALPESYVADLRSARRLLQTGIHLASNLNDYHEHYEYILGSERASIRFLIVAPEGNALRMAALRFAGGTRRVEQEQVRTQSSLDVIAELMQKYPGRVELKVIDYLLEYSGLLIESAGGQEILYMERYTFRHYGGSMKPKFTYTADNPWFRFIKNEMEELWRAAQPYPMRAGTGA